jgi:hypothetical protein
MLASICQPLVLPKKINHWLVTSLQQRPVKTGGRLLTHARYCWLLWKFRLAKLTK